MLAALSPVGPLLALKGFIASKLGLGGASGGAGAGAAGAGAGTAATGAVGSVGAAISSSGAAGGIGAVGGAIGTKAVAGVVTAAVLTAGAVEVKQQVDPGSASPSADYLAHRPRHALPGDRPRPNRPSPPVTPVTADAARRPGAGPAPTADAGRARRPPTRRRRDEGAIQSAVAEVTGEANGTKPPAPAITDATRRRARPRPAADVVVTVGGRSAAEEAPPANRRRRRRPPPAEPAAEAPPPPPGPVARGEPSASARRGRSL